MKVGLVAPPWITVPPRGYGGTENVLDALARGLAAQGCEVVLATTGDSTCPVERTWVYERAVGVEQMAIADEIRHVSAAYTALADCDVVHDHTLVGPLWAARRPGIAAVTTNHGPFNDRLTPLYREIGDEIGVIAISRDHARSAHGVPIAAVIHHGLITEEVPVGQGRGGYAAFIGRMHPDKGVVSAIHIARAAGIPLKLAAKMREVAEVDYFRTCVEPLLGGDVEYVGELGQADKYELLGSATCLLNPIRWPEPFGMVMIEALACGTPVVVSPCGAAPEIVESGVTGFVATGDDALAVAVLRAASLDRAMCRRAAERQFSSQRMAAQHITLYRQTMERGKYRAGAERVA
jgi:glycosyltransferase involved in cell wall biosynthesis